MMKQYESSIDENVSICKELLTISHFLLVIDGLVNIQLQLALKHNDPGSFLKESTKKINIDPSVNWNLIVVPIRSLVVSPPQVLRIRCCTSRRTTRVSRRTKDRNFGRYHSSPSVLRAQHPVHD